MKNLYKIALKISKSILSDEKEQWFSDEYVKLYGLPSGMGEFHKTPKGWSNSKKKRKKEECPKKIKNKDMKKELDRIYQFIQQNNINIENITSDMKKKFSEKLNNFAKKKGINDTFDEKRFDKLFNKYLDESGKRKHSNNTIFGNTEKIEKDLKQNGKRIVGHPIENHHSINRKFVFQHSSCKSIFKPVRNPIEPTNEEMAYRLDKILGFGLVPPTITSNKTTDKNKNDGLFSSSSPFFLF